MPGKIRDDDIIQIRESSDLVEVISAYVNLKKTGRIFKGLCPFHKEKTPSFVVDPQKQLFHCFGCGEGGDVYTFLMKSENLDFIEAVEVLAAKMGHKITYDLPKNKAAASKKEKMIKANSLARRYFAHILSETESGKKARDYLAQRGIEADSIASFGIGYAPANGRALMEFLIKKGFNHKDLLSGGLLTESERGTLDLFRNRVMFPIFNLKGDVIAFGGRILGDAFPKYINTPETELFHKGSTLYNLGYAKNEIARSGKALVVEGYTDVIILHQAGAKNVVATLGTALTAEHLSLLSRFTERVVLVFDSDKAGMAAAERGLELLGQSKVDLFVANLTKNMDPAEFITQLGADEFNRSIEAAIPLAEYCIKRILQKHDLKDASGRNRAIKAALSIISGIDSSLAREEYLGRLADMFGLSYEALLGELKKIKKKYDISKSVDLEVVLGAQDRCEREALKVIIQHHDLAMEAVLALSEDLFAVEANRRAYSAISKAGVKNLLPTSLIDSVSDESLKRLLTALAVEEIMAEAEDLPNHFRDILVWLKDFHLERQINRFKHELKKVDTTQEKDKADAFFKELIKLEKERRELKKSII
ncbi:MAG: DNA primase [Actinomycetota bacterium]|nr:DNA primase [Actinomycetota bacterium]